MESSAFFVARDHLEKKKRRRTVHTKRLSIVGEPQGSPQLGINLAIKTVAYSSEIIETSTKSI